MQTQCNQESFEFHLLNQRQVVGRFDGGAITSDAGGLLLREVEKRTGIIERFAACFRDHRVKEHIEHTVKELVAQRVYGLALGYEDLNDHDQLRQDPLLAVLAEKPDPSGESRVRERDRGKALAGKSTLNRLELTKDVVEGKERYKKIATDQEAETVAELGDLHQRTVVGCVVFVEPAISGFRPSGRPHYARRE